jgi:hypothetical protein
LWHWRAFGLQISHHPLAECCRPSSLLPSQTSGLMYLRLRIRCGERSAVQLPGFITNPNTLRLAASSTVTSGLYISRSTLSRRPLSGFPSHSRSRLDCSNPAFPPSTAGSSPVLDPAILKRWQQRLTFNNLQGVWEQDLGVKVQKVFPDLTLAEFPAVSQASRRHCCI